MVAMNIQILTMISIMLVYSSATFAATIDGRWHLGIGDPTILGWLTVLAYFIAVIRSYRVAASLKGIDENYYFWLGLAIILLLLGINKQLDLQTWFTQTLKDSANAHGWYEKRRGFQMLFILFLGMSMCVTLLSIRLYLAQSWHQFKLAWIGIISLGTFVFMRAASFHYMDILLNTHLLGLRLNVVFEVGGILLIILGSIYNQHKTSNIKP